ncbi:phage tail protein [Oxalicibacterium faecigallinarum]|uniref:Phage tail collar domain-containing protein n=1 Tax=Oxalicibacterium faecigallinarum TaxID=573741 RepID=A0A8J3F0L5_9BURK|nr:phage tail protein [Oxalicibacterium faecigallinarum]GGI16462.1 hypothetical protein GCM10008066_04080 [Oxalicibacterium faecigallinarum]
MPAPPERNEISDAYPNPSNATMRIGMGRLWDFVTGLLGLTGNAADARSALGVPSETDAMLLGNPVASTQSAGNKSTRLATTEFADRVFNGVTTLSVAGTGDITLTATECGTGILILTGARTANGNIIVPTAGWRQIVENSTTGAFSLTVKTVAGAGVTVTQGKQKELFSDGVAVLDANTDINALPVGAIFDHAGTTAPAGSLICPTAPTTVSRTTYAALWTAIGTTWGAGDGSTTFNIPWFPVGQVGVQANGNVGTNTVGQNLTHIHEGSSGVTGYVGTGSGGAAGGGNPVPSGASQMLSNGGSANLPAGQRVLKCVKF